MWTQGAIRTNLTRENAHSLFMKRKRCLVSGQEEWINGYEYGLFMPLEVVRSMTRIMHSEGMLIDDVVSPFMYHVAVVSGNIQNVRCMEEVIWSVSVLYGLICRPDSYKLLAHRNVFNGYEFALLHDIVLSREIGYIIRHYDLLIHKVIAFRVFTKSPVENIKAMLMP